MESCISERGTMVRASLSRHEVGYKPLREIIKSNERSGHFQERTLEESRHRKATRLLNSPSGV
jgi:hypothetical protein